MVNKRRAKGNRVQHKLVQALEAEGYLVAKAEVGGKFVKNKDMFGLFDLCCIRQDNVLFVQVTCNKPHTHKKYQIFANTYANDRVWIEQFVWMDFKGFKKFKYFPSGYKEVEELYTRGKKK